MRREDLTAEYMRRAFDYDPEAGVLTRFYDGKVLKGIPVGGDGRRLLEVLGRRHMVYRLCWLHYYGHWPNGSIDHINGDPTDNRIANLRDVTHEVNMQNRRKPSRTNKTGYLGVSPHQGKFVAGLSVDGRRRYLGIFDTPEAAHEAYLREKRKLHAGMTL